MESDRLRTCLGCKFFKFENAYPGYSDATPGGEASIECYKRVWDFDFYRDDLNKTLLKAGTCGEYEFAPERLK